MSENLTVRLGTTWGFDVPCYDANGNLVNLTGATVRWRMVGQRSLIFDLSVGYGLAIPTPTSGIVKVDVSPVMQTDVDLLPGVYEHALLVITATGARDEYLAGTVHVEQSPFGQEFF